MKEFIAHIKRMKALKSVYDKGSGQHNILSMLIDETKEALNISEKQAKLVCPDCNSKEIRKTDYGKQCSKCLLFL
jgi:hypothetical protein